MSLAFIENTTFPSQTGTWSFIDLCPLVMNSIGEVSVAISAAFTGSVELNASFSISPPSIAGTLAAIADFDTALATGITFGLPTVSFGANASIAAIAKLEAAFGLLVTLDALLDLGVTLFGTAVTGTGVSLGSQLGSEYFLQWPDDTPSAIPANVVLFAAVELPFVPAPFNPAVAADKLKRYLNGLTWGDDLGDISSRSFGNIGDLVKVAADATVQGNAAIQYQLDQTLTLAAHINVNPPTFAASIEAMAKFQADFIASGALALPRVNFVLNASASIAANLNAKFNAIVQLGLALNSPVAQMYVYAGNTTASDMRDFLTQELGPTPPEVGATPLTWGKHGTYDFSTLLPCKVGVVGASALNPGAWVAIQALFAGAPL